MKFYLFGLSGRFFEVLIGKRTEALWTLLSKVGVLYALEPILTVVFVVNMNTVWEKVMSTLRAQIFGRVLIQKVQLCYQLITLSHRCNISFCHLF